jgi:asparaginyl-tRNA synthetase
VAERLTTGASVVVEGKLVASLALGQKWELRTTRVELVGPPNTTHPLQKKGHGVDCDDDGQD